MTALRACAIWVVVTLYCTVNLVPASRSVDWNSSSTKDNDAALYYGTSAAYSELRAWFLWLDLQKRAGGMYLPPVTHSPLLDFKLNASGGLSFWAKGVIAKYTLTGKLSDEQIVADLSVTSGRRDAPPAPRVNLRLMRQFVPPPDSIDWHRSGLFSNAVMNDGSGDLNGIELLVVSALPIVGGYTDFQQEFIPYALLDTIRTHDGFTFSIKGRSFQAAYSATYRGGNLLLRQTSPAKGEDVVLRKHKSIRELLKSE
jgi:hypothetical protein